MNIHFNVLTFWYNVECYYYKIMLLNPNVKCIKFINHWFYGTNVKHDLINIQVLSLSQEVALNFIFRQQRRTACHKERKLYLEGNTKGDKFDQKGMLINILVNLLGREDLLVCCLPTLNSNCVFWLLFTTTYIIYITVCALPPLKLLLKHMDYVHAVHWCIVILTFPYLVN